jgi:hypothetical protein
MTPGRGLIFTFRELMPPPLYRFRRKKRDRLRYVPDLSRLKPWHGRFATGTAPQKTA